jgi:16S rRNA (guanine527-N7)-methyltransferase
MDRDIGVNVSRETEEALRVFADLAVKWTSRINLIAKSTVSDIWERHVLDSAQLYQYAPVYTHWVDIGSGGGFPGIVMAILAKQENPKAKFTLIESDARKCVFLRTAIRELSLNAYVQTQRIEKAGPESADVVSARALGSLSDLLPLVQRHLNATGTALLMKGRRYDDELRAVSDDWTFELAEYNSITDPESRILSLKRISRAA